MGNVTQYSFTAGEVSTDLVARTDTNKYSIALAKLKNGFVRTTGGISNRSGLEFVCEVKDSSKQTRLFPFKFSQNQQFVIEGGEGYFRYIQNGGQIIDENNNIIETLTKFKESDIFKLKYAQSADVVTFCCNSKPPQELIRYSNTNWKMRELNVEPTIESPQNVSATHSGTLYSTTTTLNYKITAIKADTYEESIPSIATAGVTASILGGWKADEVVTVSWSAVENAVECNIYKSMNGIFQFVGKSETTSFRDTGIEVDASCCIPIFKNPFDPSVVPTMESNILPEGYTVSATTSSTSHEAFRAFDNLSTTYFESTLAEASLQATQSDSKVATSVILTIKDNPLSEFNFWGSNDNGTTKTILKSISQNLTANKTYEFELENTKGYSTYGITVSGLVSGSTVQIVKLDFKENSNNPGTVSYFQQRSIYANTLNYPNSLFSSQTGLFRNFSIQRPLVATNAVTVRLDEREINDIKHIVGMADLIVFTSDSEWKINGSDGVFQATPAPVAKRQSSYGCADLMPIVAGSMILFVQAGCSIVRDFGYTFVSDSYDGKELTYLANHLFEGKQIVDWAYSKEPNRILWCVMSDGTVNALTYNKEQEILGWHQHTTQGQFESVTVVREGFEDVPYFVIKRKINGIEKRYIERMKSRIISDAKDGFFVDCGLSSTFETPVNSISGLNHLEGMDVIILADGAVISGKKVINGTVSLGSANGINITAKKITVGLPYEFELKTLNIEGEGTQGTYKSLEWFSLKLDKSREDFQIIGNDGVVQDLNRRSLESLNDNGKLTSGDILCRPTSLPSTSAYVHLKQIKPLPITILSITCNVTVSEDVQK